MNKGPSPFHVEGFPQVGGEEWPPALTSTAAILLCVCFRHRGFCLEKVQLLQVYRKVLLQATLATSPLPVHDKLLSAKRLMGVGGQRLPRVGVCSDGPSDRPGAWGGGGRLRGAVGGADSGRPLCLGGCQRRWQIRRSEEEWGAVSADNGETQDGGRSGRES